ncbi:hypothetical protein OC846_003984 [Tilletia horrida]|uniref:Uncharacterized protein n=1 Tax=Tilletia horrida TaxID=155126 RepID=A0AAN6GP40_9BASI|nr:hypothetical protein OC846_003984 [Tilletia horrida]KAK0562489.1 hypothetical protein OC861_005286 [Tilletia horrida]
MYSSTLDLAGKTEQALAAIEEGIQIFRNPPADDPTAFDSVLDLALRNYAERLVKVGRYSDALKATTASLQFYRAGPKLNFKDNDKERLADVLRDCYDGLCSQGAYEEALIASEERVNLLKSLYAANNAKHAAQLGSALNSYSVRLNEAGKQADALSASQESVQMSREAHQAESTPSIKNGRAEDALKSIEESVQLYRDLCQSSPEPRHDWGLANSLLGLSNRLAESGRLADSDAAIEDSLQKRRALYKANPSEYGPDLANHLCDYSMKLEKRDHREDAIRNMEEAVATYRAVYEIEPARVRSDLADALILLSGQLDNDAGTRNEEALAAVDEATQLFKTLDPSHWEEPGQYEGTMATAQYGRSLLLGKAKRNAEALTAVDESLAMGRKVVESSQVDALKELIRDAEDERRRLLELTNESSA